VSTGKFWIGALGGLIGLGYWFCYQLLVQHGRVLLRVEALENRSPASPAVGALTRGLPLGTVMHDFDLPTLAGGRMTRSQWRGRRLVVIFVDPACRFSRTLLRELAMRPMHASRTQPQPLIVSRGSVEANRELLPDADDGWPVVLQSDDELAALYRVDATPMAYLIDEQGATASELIVGAQAVIDLVDAVSARPDWRPGDSPLDTLPLTTSRLNRNGLSVGSAAPSFRLPLVTGGETTLEDYRGRPLLLVFSDPACGPCDQLIPDLERVHQQQPALQLLMISRGDPDTNRKKVAEHGLTFPIALQRHWEVSRAYGMFATPVAYLVDERGVIVADIAVGVEPIRELAKQQDMRVVAGGGRR
jgi:peroxiredoxin